MHTRLCDRFGIEFPIFAFTHCRDVAAEVTRAGGLGVLGAVGFTPEQLEMELAWMDDQVQGRPYGVDFVMPARSLDVGDATVDDLGEQLKAMLPVEHVDFVDSLIDRFGLERPSAEDDWGGVLGWTPEVADQLLDVALAHPVALLVNALGPPPAHVVERAHEQEVMVAALAGLPQHAESHVRAGADLVIAQGTEAGGHTGDVATMVLVPQVVDAVGPDVPVLAAGGISRGGHVVAALALGADGVWTGSMWLTVAENDFPEEVRARYLQASSTDTVRSRNFTGKPARMLRNEWTDAWEADDAPETLGMPLQNILIAPAFRSFQRAGRLDEMFAPVGQVVGDLNSVRSTRDVVLQMVEEYVDVMERLEGFARG